VLAGNDAVRIGL